jgi:hypothetical protein
MSSAASAPLNIDPSELLPPLRRMFGSDDVTVVDYECQRPRGTVGTTSASIMRVCGNAVVDGQPCPWSMIRKSLVALPPGQVDPYGCPVVVPSGLSYWKREFYLYQSGLLDGLPHGLAAPRCFHAEERPDGCVIWMEEILDEIPIWPLERHGLAARHLGLLSGLYLTERAAPDFPWLTTRIVQQKESRNRGFFERMDELRQHEIVRRGWPDDVAAGIQRIWRERERFYRCLDGLPRVFQHADAGRRNLMSRTGPDGEPETVAIDWGVAGVGALGEEIAPTVLLPVEWFLDVAPAQLPELDKVVFEGFLQGLREAGWRGDPRLPRLGYLCIVALLFGPNMIIPEALAVEMFQEDWRGKQTPFGWTVEEWADQLREMRRFVITRAEEARRLMVE